MSSDILESKTDERSTVYGTIGIAIYLICFGTSYLLPHFFPKGSLFAVAGFLILLVSCIKVFKNIGSSLLEFLFGIVFLIIGLNKIFMINIGFFPVVIVVLAIVLLLQSIRKLSNGQIFD